MKYLITLFLIFSSLASNAQPQPSLINSDDLATSLATRVSTATTVNGQALTGDVSIIPSDYLPWLTRSIGDGRINSNNFVLKPMLIGDSWTSPLNLDNALRGQFGFLGNINEGSATMPVTCTTTNASTTVTTSTSTYAVVGMVVSGPNIPASTTVTAVTPPTQFTISNAATGSGSVGLTFGDPTITTTQHTRYSAGSYNGRSKVLSAAGHFVSAPGETGARGEPATRFIVAYRRVSSGGGVFQPKVFLAPIPGLSNNGTWVNAGPTISTTGAVASEIVWQDYNFSGLHNNSAASTQIRFDWVSGSCEIIAVGMMYDSTFPAVSNRHGVLGYNSAFPASDVNMWNTVPQQAWDAIGTYYGPNLVLVREFRELNVTTTDWLNGFDSLVEKIRAGRRSATTATFSLLAPGGSTFLNLSADAIGLAGENVRVKFIAAGISTPLSVSVVGNDITVNLATDGSGNRTSTGTQVINALNNSGPAASPAAAALVTATSGISSGSVIPSYPDFFPFSCGVGVDFVFAGAHPCSSAYEAHNNESDRVLRNWCAARRFLFVDVRKAFPTTFEQSFARGFNDTDGLHLTATGNQLVVKTILEHLKLREVTQPFVFGSQALQPQFVGGQGVSGSWYINYNAGSTNSMPELGLRRADAGTTNSASWWSITPVPIDSTIMSTGILEKIGSPFNTFRQTDQYGRTAFGYSNNITKTIGERALFTGSTVEIGGRSVNDSKLTVSGISGQVAPILRVVIGASESAAGTETGGFASNGRLFGTLTTPASATATGIAGTVVWDADFIYVCTAPNTWKRVAIATW